MSADLKYTGLCSTCKQASDCVFARDCRKPVFSCEEFDTGKPSPARRSSKDRSPPPLSYAAKLSNSARFAGLCSDCEDREACTFPKPEGGVWHCEEYR